MIRKLLLPVLVSGIALMVFFYPVFLQAKIPFAGDLLVSQKPWETEYSFPNKAQGQDIIRQLYLWRIITTDNIKSWTIPLWNPYSFSGTPHLANFQTAIFSWITPLFFLISQIDAWTIYYLSDALLTVIFTYFLLRQWKLTKKSSFFGGLIYSYSLYLMVWRVHLNNIPQTAMFLPLILLGIERKNSLLLIFSMTFAFLSGHIQTFLYITSLSFFYSLFLKRTKMFLLAGIITIGLTAVQWLSTAEISMFAPRLVTSAQYIFDTALQPIQWFVTIFAPDFYGNQATRNFWFSGSYFEKASYVGVITLFFTLVAFFQRKIIQNWRIRFFIVAAFLSILLSLKISPIQWFYSLNFPIIGTAVPTRILLIFTFSISMLGAFGFNYFTQNKIVFNKIIKPTLLLTIIYGFLWIMAIMGKYTIAQRNLILPSVMLVGVFILTTLIIKLGKIKNILLIIIIILSVFDLFYYGWKFTPFVNRQLVYPKTSVFTWLNNKGGINRFFGVEDGYIDTNYALSSRLFSPEGYDPLFIGRYGELVNASYFGQLKKEIPRSDVNIPKIDDVYKFTENSYRRKLMQLLGIKYIVDKDDLGQKGDFKAENYKFNPELFNLVWQDGKWKIYEYKEALPRFFLANSYETIVDKQQIINKLLNNNVDLKQTVILEEKIPAFNNLLNKETASFVEMEYYQPNQAKFKVSTNTDKILFLSDNYYPGWKAYMDGKETKIYRADYTFRAIVVPTGVHTVIFSYEPWTFKIGMIISGLSIALFLILLKIKKLKSQ